MDQRGENNEYLSILVTFNTKSSALPKMNFFLIVFLTFIKALSYIANE